ncbi:hypothetical protein B0H10DRAFT_305519 [Mycena sp. CBHHK59/15]|nr:hypothetical protein B0H10DRAFT_305519 [Mycena sp. CBHHK59/15]
MLGEILDREEMVAKQPLDARSIGYDTFLQFIPVRLWPQVYKTFIVGYNAVIKAIAQVLSRSNFILPTKWTDDTQRVATWRCGIAKHALDAIIDSTEARARLSMDDKQMLHTPECQNDREFAVVRKNLWLDPTQDWGPYSQLPKTPMDFDMYDEDEDSEEEMEDDGDMEEGISE